MINSEIELISTWSKKDVLADMTARAAGGNNDPPIFVAPTGLEFQITGIKLHILVATLSKENGKKHLEQWISGFKRTVINTDHKWLSSLKITT